MTDRGFNNEEEPDKKTQRHNETRRELIRDAEMIILLSVFRLIITLFTIQGQTGLYRRPEGMEWKKENVDKEIQPRAPFAF